MTEQFRQLVQISLGLRDRFDTAPSETEWHNIYAEAEKQTMTGVLFTGIDRLPEGQTPPFKVRGRFAMMTWQIADKTVLASRRAEEATRFFADHGRRSYVLKGPAVARLYEFPERRQSGDLDIWVEGSTESTIELLRQHFTVDDVVYHHVDVKMFEDVATEIHFHPTWMNSYPANKKLQRYFESAAPWKDQPETGFNVPSEEFDLVFSLVHIFRHLFYEGVGLRQLIDYYQILRHSSEEERRSAMKVIDELHLRKFAAALMWVMRDWLGYRGALLTDPDPKAGQALMAQALAGGNFGKFDKTNRHPAGEGLAPRLRRNFHRKMGLLLTYPREVLWAPVFKTWQYIWRRRHKGYVVYLGA